MRMLLYNCEKNVLELDGKITVLEVENPKVFNGILSDFYVSTYPYNELAVESDKGLLLAKDIFCLIDLYNFDLQNKLIISKLYKYLDKYITENTMLRLKYDQAFREFSNAIHMLLSDIDVDFDFQQTNEVKNALSLINLMINVGDNAIVDRLLQFIKISSEMNLYKIIVLVNAKAFFTSEELKILYKQSLYYKIPLILLENHNCDNLLENEQKLFVDENFCDIIIM